MTPTARRIITRSEARRDLHGAVGSSDGGRCHPLWHSGTSHSGRPRAGSSRGGAVDIRDAGASVVAQASNSWHAPLRDPRRIAATQINGGNENGC